MAHDTTTMGSGTTRAVALVSERADLAHEVSAALGRGLRLRTQPWRLGGEALEPERVVKEMASFDEPVVCVGDDVPLPLALGIASVADRDYADMTVILLRSPTTELWRDALRAGVRDVVAPHSLDGELTGSVQRALDRAARRRGQLAAPSTPPVPVGRVIVVLSPKGGSGKTMVASNLTASLGALGAGSVALVDLDVQFGDSALALGLTPERTFGELVTEPTIDSTTLKVFLTPHDPSGAFVLCGSSSPEDGEMVSDEAAVRVVQLLARDFGYVVVDTPAGLDERTLAVLEVASEVVLVSTMDVSSIRALGKDIDVLDRLGLLPAQRMLVLNRADSKVGIEPEDVQAALGMTIDVAIPSSRSVPVSMNQGRALVLEEPSSPAARELTRLARRLVTGQDEDEKAGRRSWRRKAR